MIGDAIVLMPQRLKLDALRREVQRLMNEHSVELAGLLVRFDLRVPGRPVALQEPLPEHCELGLAPLGKLANLPQEINRSMLGSWPSVS